MPSDKNYKNATSKIPTSNYMIATCMKLFDRCIDEKHYYESIGPDEGTPTQSEACLYSYRFCVTQK